MFVELNGLLGLEESGDLSGRSVLLTEAGAEASFVLHHFLGSYVRQGHNVLLVLLSQSLSHYTVLGNKLGVNLSKAREDGSLVVVEGLKQLGKVWANEEDQADDLINFHAEKTQALKPLYEHIKAAHDRLPSTKPTLVIIDDLSVPVALGLAAADVVAFMHALHAGVLSTSGLLALLPGGGGEDEELEGLGRALGHLALGRAGGVRVRAEGLPSGFCRDVHGELSVQHSGGRRRMQYKVSDKHVSFFALGTSAAVL